MRVLLVEDDAMIASGLQQGLRQSGFAVDWVADGSAALLALQASNFDLVLLDLGLPKRDGQTVLRAVRAAGDKTPVIILTARDEIQHRVAGLNAGADDYIVKPFDLDEVIARIRSVLRRSAGRAEPVILHGDLRLDPAMRTVHVKGEPVAVSPHEFAVLEALLQRPGLVLSRAQIEDRLYGWNDSIGSNAVEVYIHGLRRKLGSDSIRTVRGVGYFVPKEPVS
jgi:DNA-binding response OmpR family regulator